MISLMTFSGFGPGSRITSAKVSLAARSASALSSCSRSKIVDELKRDAAARMDKLLGEFEGVQDA
jgi:hypothetical protein